MATGGAHVGPGLMLRTNRFHFDLSPALVFFALAFAVATEQATALDFRVDFRNSTYQSQVGDTFSDLLAQHESEALIQSTVTTGLENISTAVYGGGGNNNYSMMMMATLDIGIDGEYTFQVGTDWGRGGSSTIRF
jgi:hypothetical protein